mmetsp:Transcript_9794/g.16169  ORF Transcript_9794/g.16169 Transcript_9794/m.16169 type:complete len:102 (-) Transcript_9794:36-341(-)
MSWVSVSKWIRASHLNAQNSFIHSFIPVQIALHHHASIRDANPPLSNLLPRSPMLLSSAVPARYAFTIANTCAAIFLPRLGGLSHLHLLCNAVLCNAINSL